VKPHLKEKEIEREKRRRDERKEDKTKISNPQLICLEFESTTFH
jgi:hypothetical protein